MFGPNESHAGQEHDRGREIEYKEYLVDFLSCCGPVADLLLLRRGLSASGLLSQTATAALQPTVRYGRQEHLQSAFIYSVVVLRLFQKICQTTKLQRSYLQEVSWCFISRHVADARNTFLHI